MKRKSISHGMKVILMMMMTMMMMMMMMMAAIPMTLVMDITRGCDEDSAPYKTRILSVL